MLDANVTVRRGELRLEAALTCRGTTVVMGPNGAGKSTLLQALLGAIRPEDGYVRFGDEILFDHERGIDLPAEERGLAYVPQGYGLFPHLEVLDNVMFGIRTGGRQARIAHALRILDDLGVRPLARRRPTELSGGEMQRVALARAVASSPRVLLLDEPLSALDQSARPKVRRFLGDWLRASRLRTVLVTHDASDARELADELVVLEAGRVVQRGTPDHVAFRPATEFVAALTAGLIERDDRSVPPPGMLTEDE
ncbi:MAG: hypothetical protein SangKO_020860 [Sandaracinaceae bacterium]|nr:ABC transporter ATP-binding protein [Myxococcales bacterium]